MLQLCATLLIVMRLATLKIGHANEVHQTLPVHRY